MIGAGHAVRCASLAQAAVAAGHSVRLLGLDAGRQVYAWAWQGLDSDTESTDLVGWLQRIAAEGPDWVVIDHYRIDDRWLAALPPGTRSLVIDDVPAGRALDRATLVLNQNLGVDGWEYPGPALIGPEYALIRPAFTTQAHVGGDPILVLPGGTDAASIAGACARALEGCGEVLVVGNPRDLPPWARASGILDSGALAAAMGSAKAGVFAAGSAIWEACTVGLPLVAIQVADNQDRICAGLRERGWAPVLRPNELDRLPALIATLPQRGQPRLDGAGAERILARMEALCRA
jgi:spore coat polysaccharide biosynthesis predicted glycosyltransferase SpsG